MPRKSTKKLPKKVQRRRELNLIYFVDSSSTRSFKLPIRQAQCIAVLLAAIVLWSFSSLWVIYRMSNTIVSLEGRTSGLLAAVFDYQTRFDSVYETAYPSDKDSSNNIAAVTLVPEPTEKKVESTSTVSSRLSLAAKPLTGLPGSDATAIDPPTFVQQETQLVMNFAIKNARGDGRSSGFVYAIARLVDPTGKEIFVAQPPGIDVDATGKAKKPLMATKFTIRKFKPVTVDFSKPAGITGEFKDVRIVIRDDEGQEKENNFTVIAARETTSSLKAARASEARIDSQPPAAPAESTDQSTHDDGQ